jgi:hypothetical protein
MTTTAPAPAKSTAPAKAAAPPPAGPAKGATLRVRATDKGYYGDARRRIGDVFDLVPRKGPFTAPVLDKDGEPKLDPRTQVPLTKEVTRILTAEEQFSAKWMEKVDPHTPTSITTGAEELRQKHDAEIAARRSPSAPPPAGAATGAANPLGDD